MKILRNSIPVVILFLAAISLSGCKSTKDLGSIKSPQEILINPESVTLGNPNTDIGVFKVELTGDVLMIKFGQHKVLEQINTSSYELATFLQVNKSNPVQLIITLRNRDLTNTGLESEDFMGTMYFDLTPLKKQFKNGKFEYDKVILNVNGKNYSEYKLN